VFSICSSGFQSQPSWSTAFSQTVRSFGKYSKLDCPNFSLQSVLCRFHRQQFGLRFKRFSSLSYPGVPFGQYYSFACYSNSKLILRVTPSSLESMWLGFSNKSVLSIFTFHEKDFSYFLMYNYLYLWHLGPCTATHVSQYYSWRSYCWVVWINYFYCYYLIFSSLSWSYSTRPACSCTSWDGWHFDEMDGISFYCHQYVFGL
jgi:hypothetical protein